MLGEQIFCFEEGRFVYYKMLRDGKWEDTEEYKGTFVGEESILTLTAEGDFYPDGTGYAELWGVFTTKGGSRCRFKGIGSLTINPDGPNSWRGALLLASLSNGLSRLNGKIVIFEGEWDDSFLRLKGWEWK